MNVRFRSLRAFVVAASLTMAIAACGSTTSGVVGNWTCRSPANPNGDSVEIKADGGLTVTKPDGTSATGTWTMTGSTMTVNGLGPGGSEQFTFADDKITGTGEQVCTRS